MWRHALRALAMLTAAWSSSQASESDWLKSRFRVTLASETPTVWRGELTLSEGRLSNHRPLSIDPEAAIATRVTEGRVVLDHRVAQTGDAFDVTAFGPPGANLQCRLFDKEGRAVATASIPVAAARVSPLKAELGEPTRWIQLNRPDGDRLRVETERDSLLFGPGEEFAFLVIADPPGVERGETFDLQATVSRGRRGGEVWRGEPVRVESLDLDDAGQPMRVPLPQDEGVYRITLTAQRPPGFRARFLPNSTAAPLVERSFQIAVFDAAKRPPTPGDWRETYAFDPSYQRWSDRLPDWMRWRRLPWFATGPLSSEGRTATTQVAPTTASGAANWRAYPLPIDEPGSLYAAEVEPLGAAGQPLTIGLLEPDAAGTLRPLGRAITDYGERWEAANPREPLRLTFRPRTNSPLLVIANPSQQQAVRFGKIRLLKSSGTPAGRPETNRLVAVDWPDADLATAVGASLAMPGGAAVGVPDLQTHWETARTLADRAEVSGSNAAIVPVNQQGSAIYESNEWRSPRLDRSVWYDATGDLPRIDLLQLVLAEFHRRDLKVIPAIRFDAPAACQREDTNPTTADNARRRITVLRDLLGELNEHAAIGGYAVRVSSSGWALPSPGARADNAAPPEAGDAGRASELVARAYNDLGSVIRGARSLDPPLVLLTDEVVARPTVAAATAPQLGVALADAREPLRTLGLGFAADATQTFAVAAPYGATVPFTPNRQASGAASRDRVRQALPVGETTAVRTLRSPTTRVRLAASAERLSRDPSGGARDMEFPCTVVANSSERAFLAAAATEPVQLLAVHGGAAAGVLDEITANRRRQLAALPASVSPAEPRDADVTAVAYDTDEGGSMAVVTNQSAWTRSVRATVNTPERTLGARVDADRGRGEWFDKGEHVIEIELQPYETAAWRFRGPGVSVAGVRVQPNTEALAELAAGVAELRSRDTTQRRPVDLIPNASFDEAGSSGEAAFYAWEATLGVERSADAPHTGAAAARLCTVDGEPAVLTSPPFTPPATGQLVMGLWVRAGELKDETELQIEITSRDGRYRNSTRLAAAQLVDSTQEDGGAQSPEWREVVFPMDDLPLESESPLQLQLTLVGGGDVDVDSLWLEDLLLPLDGYGAIDLRSEKLALVGLFSAADGTLEEGRLEACRELLDSYWARFLVENFPEREEATLDVAKQEDDEASDAAEGDEEPTPPSVTERLRGYLWRSWW